MKTLKYCIKYWWNNNKTNFITDILNKHYILEYNENEPDIIICSIFWLNIKKLKEFSGLKIFYAGESHTRFDNSIFDIDNCISISFNPTSNTNIQYIGQYTDVFQLNFDKIFNERIFLDNLFDRNFCINIISSPTYGINQSDRIHICDVIDNYKKQDYGGRWRNTVTIPAGLENTPEIIKNYKFNYCAENTSNKYYITEKIVNAFLGNSIPIYWGGEANLIFNEGSFINLNNKSDEEIIEIIKEIDTDKNKYKQMFETPLLKDPHFFENQRNNIEQFLVNHIDKIL